MKIKDKATGDGLDISIGVSVGYVYYWGDVNKFSYESLQGQSFGVELSAGFIGSASQGVHFGTADIHNGHTVLQTQGISLEIPIPFILGGQGKTTFTTITP